MVEVPAKIIYSGKIVIWDATFVHAQLLLVQHPNTVVVTEHVKHLVPRQHAHRQNANAIQDGLEVNAKYHQVAFKNISWLIMFERDSLFQVMCTSF